VNNLIKKNSKQTEVGVIPKDWQVTTFNDLFKFLPTGNNTRSELTNDDGEVNYIHYGDIHKKWELILDCDQAEIPFISREKIRNLPFVREGDLIIADASEDYEGIGTSVEVRNVKDRKIVSGLHTLLLRGDEEKIVDGYKAYLTSIFSVKRAIISKATGISVYGISKDSIKNTKIALPLDLREQKAIAQILFDTDKLITLLNKLIEKKKNVKQGVMQELLTGKKRLPGFDKYSNNLSKQYQQTEFGKVPKDWKLIQLKDIVDPTRSIRYGIVQPGNFDPNGIYMIRGQDYSESKGWARPSEVFKVSAVIEKKYKNARVKTGDIIMTIVGYCGHVDIIPEWLDGANLTQTTARISVDDRKALNKFCKYQLESSFGKLQVAMYLKGAAQPGLNCEDVEKFILALPSIPEQSAIAQVLSDMHSEIEELEQKRDKYRQLKIGMMQQLLTGRIRLKWKS